MNEEGVSLYICQDGWMVRLKVYCDQLFKTTQMMLTQAIQSELVDALLRMFLFLFKTDVFFHDF